MKFRLPRKCGAISHAGRAVGIVDACVDLDEAEAALLRPHGLRPIGEIVPLDPEKIGTMSTADLVAALAAREVAAPRNANDKTLRGLLRQALARPDR